MTILTGVQQPLMPTQFGCLAEQHLEYAFTILDISLSTPVYATCIVKTGFLEQPKDNSMKGSIDGFVLP